MIDGKLLFSPTNSASWRFIVAFFQERTSNPYLEYLRPIHELVERLAASGYADRFRAGQSLYSLMISTAPYHGLNPDDPYVFVGTVGYHSDLFRVEYCSGELQDDLVEERCCKADELWPNVTALIERLWDDTQGRYDEAIENQP
jgi:hypothetical protein